ncbi:MAG: hypothetical protein ACKOTZ_00445 [Chloroflexota bacterium]
MTVRDGDVHGLPDPDEPTPDLPTPSWVDRLQVVAARAPGGPWSAYLAIGLALAGLMVTARALAGDPGAGAWDRVASAAYPVYALALMDLLDRAALRALHAFRPALPDDHERIAWHRSRLTTLPARPTLAAGAAFALLSVAGMVADPVGRGIAGSPPGLVLVRGVFDAIGIAVLGTLLFHTLHQLRAVVDVLAAATRLDLFRPGPLYAFSGVTAATGIGLLAIPVYGLLTDPAGWSGPESALFIALVMVAATAGFLLPLLGAYRRIRGDRDRLAAEVGGRLQDAMRELHDRLDAGDPDGVKRADTAVSALAREWELIQRLPVSPWRATTLRAFVSALLVPLALWFVTRLLERVVPG